MQHLFAGGTVLGGQVARRVVYAGGGPVQDPGDRTVLVEQDMRGVDLTVCHDSFFGPAAVVLEPGLPRPVQQVRR